MEKYKIRPAIESDVPFILQTERRCFSKPWTEEGIRAEISEPTGLFLLCFTDGIPCGYVNSRTAADECYIGNLAVSPAYRRRGVGERLLAALIENRKESGCSFISLEVRESNLPAAALYEKLGFRPVGKRKNFYSDPSENAVIYTLFF